MNAEMNSLKLEQRSSLEAVEAKERELRKIQVLPRRAQQAHNGGGNIYRWFCDAPFVPEHPTLATLR